MHFLRPPKKIAIPLGAAIALYAVVLAWNRVSNPTPSAPQREQEAAPTAGIEEIIGASAQDFTPAPDHSAWEERLRQILLIGPAGERLEKLADLAREVTQVDILEARELLRKIAAEEDRDTFIQAMFAQWARQDPDLASLTAASCPDGNERSAAVGGVVLGWAEQDPSATAEWLEQLPYDTAARMAGVCLATSWVRQAPAVALAWARQRLRKNDSFTYKGCISAWAEYNPTVACAWAEQDPEDATILGAVTDGWRRRPETEDSTILSWLLQLPAGRNRNATLGSSLRHWADADPRAAAAWLQQLDLQKAGLDAVWLNSRNTDMAIGFARAGDVVSARRYAMSIPEGERYHALTGMFGWAAHQNPQAAFDLVRQMIPEGKRNVYLRCVYSEWSRSNPEEAFAAACQLPESRNNTASEIIREEVLPDLLTSIARTNPEWSLNLLNRLTENERQEFAPSVLSGWKSSDTLNALKWVTQLPEGKQKELCLASLKNSGFYGFKQDPIRMTEWGAKLPNGPIAETIWPGIAQGFGGLWPATISKWLSTLPPGRARDLAICDFAVQLSFSRSLEAGAWISKIQDPALRDTCGKQVAAISRN